MTPNVRDTCSLCPAVARFDDAAEIADIRSNVRRWREQRFTVWRCPSCGSLHSLNRVDLAPYYADYPYENRRLDLWTRLVFSNYLRRLRRHGLTPHSTVLDYGCSRGIFLRYLRQRGIEHCFGYDAYVEEFNDTDVLRREYDFVVAQDVVEHLEDPEELLRDLYSCVVPGGVLCIGTPRAEEIDLLDPESYIHSLHQPYHIRIFSEQALEALARECGFLVEKTYQRSYFDTLIPFVNWTFISEFLKTVDNTLDAGFEPPNIGKMLSHPKVILSAFLGYFWPIRTEMMMLCRRPPTA